MIRAVGLLKAKANGKGDDFDVWDQKVNAEWERVAGSVLSYEYTPTIPSSKKFMAWFPLPKLLP